MGNPLIHDPNLRRLVRQIRSAHSHPFQLKHLLAEYEVKYGDAANSAVLEIAADDTKRIWEGIAYDRGRNSIDDLLELLWFRFEETGGEYEVQRENDSLIVHATKCPIADVYHKIGKEPLGKLFHCSTDSYIVKGFNILIEFTNTQTLMDGHNSCDHCYTMKHSYPVNVSENTPFLE